MSQVTRITQAEVLTRRKRHDLAALAKALGKVRVYVWNKYGSVSGTEKSAYEIQNEVRPRFKYLNIASHVLGGTIIDAAMKIKASREAAKVQVVRAIFRHTTDEAERKRLCTALKVDRSHDGYQSWTEDRYLRRQMRKSYTHGHSHCKNQITLPCDCYEWFSLRGRGFIDINGFVARKAASGRTAKRGVRRIAVPLRTNRKIEGAIRVILKGNDVEVHYGIEAADERPCGEKTLGVDKGYSEVLVDSDGDRHGVGLGALLSAESDCLKGKYRARNHLQSIAEGNPAEPDKPVNPVKRAHIEKFNLGRKKLDARKDRHRTVVSTLIHNAAHSVVGKAKTIAVEDLTKKFASKDYGANQNRRLSAWVKGMIAEALTHVANRRRASVKLVNAAYTSQICCKCGCFGKRVGDRFYCEVCGDVKRCDQVAARNVLARLTDKQIGLYTPYQTVKAILLERSLPRLRLSNQDSSCAEVQSPMAATVASTESELPDSGHGRPWLRKREQDGHFVGERDIIWPDVDHELERKLPPHIIEEPAFPERKN